MNPMAITAGLGMIGSLSKMAGKAFGGSAADKASSMTASREAHFAKELNKAQKNGFGGLSPADQQEQLLKLLGKKVTLTTRSGEIVSGTLENADFNSKPPTAIVNGKSVAITDIQSVA